VVQQQWIGSNGLQKLVLVAILRHLSTIPSPSHKSHYIRKIP
jgi:hypothetical protein